MKTEQELADQVRLQHLRLKSFEFALSLKPLPSYGTMGNVLNHQHSSEALIRDANKIYQELIKQ